MDRSSALGLLALAGFAWGLPPVLGVVRDGARLPPAAVYSLSPAASGGLRWSPRAVPGPDPRDGQVLGPDGTPAGPLEGWTGLLFGHPLDLNAATADDLEALPRVGPKTAQAILDDRRNRGPFRSIDDLARVRGVGPRTVERLRPLVRVGTPAPG